MATNPIFLYVLVINSEQDMNVRNTTGIVNAVKNCLKAFIRFKTKSLHISFLTSVILRELVLKYAKLTNI